MRATTVRNIPESYTFVCDSQEVASVKEVIGTPANPYDAFFVSTSGGEYGSVYGIVGTVPYLSKLATKLN
jgi:hypothetical protein